jgi:hypothetical protein
LRALRLLLASFAVKIFCFASDGIKDFNRKGRKERPQRKPNFEHTRKMTTLAARWYIREFAY